jgi:hypothetical protein
LYEGDSLLRSGPAFGEDTAPEAPAPAETAREPVSAFELSESEIEAKARAMRAKYVGELLQRAWARLEAWVEKGRRAREEAYLARAQNLSDLEDRMRKLERDGYIPHV